MLPLEPQDGRLTTASVWQRLIEASGTDGIALDLPCATADPKEVELLMEAWYHERSQAIETRMWLARVEKLLVRLMADEPLSDVTARQIRKLLQGLAKLERPS